jgi:hypothetical protein
MKEKVDCGPMGQRGKEKGTGYIEKGGRSTE